MKVNRITLIFLCFSFILSCSTSLESPHKSHLSGIDTKRALTDNETKDDKSEESVPQMQTEELNQEIKHLKAMLEFAKMESDENIAQIRNEIEKIWDKIKELEKRVKVLEDKVNNR